LNSEDGKLFVGVIQGIRWYQSNGFRRDYYMIDYCVNPIEFVGMEVDEEIWIPECHINDLPKIIGPDFTP